MIQIRKDGRCNCDENSNCGLGRLWNNIRCHATELEKYGVVFKSFQKPVAEKKNYTIKKVADGKSVCRVVGCKKHTKNKSRICTTCTETLNKTHTAKKKTGARHKRKPITQTEWQKQATSTFTVMSRYVRLRDTDANGYGRCISTGKAIFYIKTADGKTRSNCHAGHYISRGIKSIMFDENNVHAQYWKSNVNQGERKVNFTDNMIDKVGLTEVQRLQKAEKMVGLNPNQKPSILQLKYLRKKYRDLEKIYLKTKNWA